MDNWMNAYYGLLWITGYGWMNSEQFQAKLANSIPEITNRQGKLDQNSYERILFSCPQNISITFGSCDKRQLLTVLMMKEYLKHN